MTRPLCFALRLDFESALIFGYSAGEWKLWVQRKRRKKILLNVQICWFSVDIYTYTWKVKPAIVFISSAVAPTTNPDTSICAFVSHQCFFLFCFQMQLHWLQSLAKKRTGRTPQNPSCILNSAAGPGKHASSCRVPPPLCLLFPQIPSSVRRELTVVFTPVHLLRSRRNGGLPRPRVRARSQRRPTRHLAVGAGWEQPEPDWKPRFYRTVVTACAHAEQQPNTGNTTSGRDYETLSVYTRQLLNLEIESPIFCEIHFYFNLLPSNASK